MALSDAFILAVKIIIAEEALGTPRDSTMEQRIMNLPCTTDSDYVKRGELLRREVERRFYKENGFYD